MTGRKRWMAAVIAESRKEAPALPFTRRAKQAKHATPRIVVKGRAA